MPAGGGLLLTIYFQDSEEAGPLLVIGERRLSRPGVSSECRWLPAISNIPPSFSWQAVCPGAGAGQETRRDSVPETNQTAGLLPGPAQRVELREPGWGARSGVSPAQGRGRGRSQRTKCQHRAETFYLLLQSSRAQSLQSGQTPGHAEDLRADKSNIDTRGLLSPSIYFLCSGE